MLWAISACVAWKKLIKKDNRREENKDRDNKGSWVNLQADSRRRNLRASSKDRRVRNHRVGHSNKDRRDKNLPVDSSSKDLRRKNHREDSRTSVHLHPDSRLKDRNSN